MQLNVQPMNRDNSESPKGLAIFGLAFRPFFLLGALFSIIAVTLWVIALAGWVNFSPYGGGLWWHSHEMLFGFVSAIVVGFLLTAVQNWSGIPGVKGGPLIGLVILWLIARILLAVDSGIAPWILVVVDTAFMPVAAIFLAIPILKKKLYRNLFFIPLLLLMSAANFLMHLAMISGDYSLINTGSYAMVMLVTFLMCVMGGRVFPMFTANGTRTPKVEPIAWLEKLSILSMAVVALSFASGYNFSETYLAVITFVAAVTHFVRCLRWRFWVTLKTPLVWSLHVSYFSIPLGLLCLSLHYGFNLMSFSLALHVITVGAIGTMILAMISRVSLGHTGRLIVVGHLMAVAFAALAIAMISRSILPLFFDDYILLLLVSGGLWLTGFGIFVIQYFSVLTRPRIDGRPG